MRSIARRVLLAGGALLAALGLAAAPAAATADDWGQRVAGRHVYDSAGALTPAQVGDLEAASAAVDRAGAPTVVYLRSKSADDAGTRQDARDLMDAWAVESAPGAKDGFVLLLNLKPGDPRHGSAALVAGASHADSGRLGADRLQAVYDGEMKPRLAAGDLAGALTAALSDVTGALSKPVPTAVPRTAQNPSPAAVAGMLLGAAGLVAGGVVLLVLLARGGGSSGGGPGGGGPRRQGWRYAGDGSSSSSSFTGGDGGASSGSSSGGGSF